MKAKTTKKDGIVGRPIRLNRQDLKLNDEEYASVIFLGDIHYGSPQCDVKRFLAMVKYCLDTSTYVLLMGDLIEVGTKGSVGAGVYEQETITDSQFEQMVEWLKPLSEKGLILGTHRGNHEARVYNDCGVDIAKSFARELKVPYLGDACWSRFKVGNEYYHLYTLHGRTGSKFDGTALLAIERISVSFFADMVAMGH